MTSGSVSLSPSSFLTFRSLCSSAHLPPSDGVKIQIHRQLTEVGKLAVAGCGCCFRAVRRWWWDTHLRRCFVGQPIRAGGTSSEASLEAEEASSVALSPAVASRARRGGGGRMRLPARWEVAAHVDLMLGDVGVDAHEDRKKLAEVLRVHELIHSKVLGVVQ
ncbi:hypothetical protein EJB05_36820, partial [Eragrostis curvula]